MNPLLWLNAVTLPLLLTATYVLREQVYIASPLALVAAVIPLWTLREYSYFRRVDPQRLQSEEFLIAQQRLMIQSKASPVPVQAESLPTSDNPELSSTDAEVALPAPFKGETGSADQDAFDD